MKTENKSKSNTENINYIKIRNILIAIAICFCFIPLVNASDKGLAACYSFDDGEGNVLYDYL